MPLTSSLTGRWWWWRGGGGRGGGRRLRCWDDCHRGGGDGQSNDGAAITPGGDGRRRWNCRRGRTGRHHPPEGRMPRRWGDGGDEPALGAWDGAASSSAGAPWPPWGKRGGLAAAAARAGKGEVMALTGTSSCGISACRCPCACGSSSTSGPTSPCTYPRRPHPPLLLRAALGAGSDAPAHAVGGCGGSSKLDARLLTGGSRPYRG